MIHETTFEKEQFWSEGFADINEITQILLQNIPNAVNVERAEAAADLAGTDYWIHRQALRPLSVDLKARAHDPVQEYGEDDLALETWSVIEKAKIGWTRNPDKQTDYVLWYFGGSRRWVLIPFPFLCAVFMEKWQEWAQKYRCATQCTKSDKSADWHSQCVFVPRRVVWQAIYERYAGPCPDKTPLVNFAER